MIKKDVLLRSEIRTIYSSEKQERMKVYFELTERIKLVRQVSNNAHNSAKCIHKSTNQNALKNVSLSMMITPKPYNRDTRITKSASICKLRTHRCFIHGQDPDEMDYFTGLSVFPGMKCLNDICMND
jgi:hypothetical protein